MKKKNNRRERMKEEKAIYKLNKYGTNHRRTGGIKEVLRMDDVGRERTGRTRPEDVKESVRKKPKDRDSDGQTRQILQEKPK